MGYSGSLSFVNESWQNVAIWLKYTNLMVLNFTKYRVSIWGHFWPSGTVLGWSHYYFRAWLTLTFNVKFNLKAKFTPFWACPCHNSPPNANQFGHCLGGDWPGPSRSNLACKFLKPVSVKYQAGVALMIISPTCNLSCASAIILTSSPTLLSSYINPIAIDLITSKVWYLFGITAELCLWGSMSHMHTFWHACLVCSTNQSLAYGS